MRVLVTGATGQLGQDVCRVLAERGVEYRGIGSAQLDITDKAAVYEFVTDCRPDAVIHCAAYTAVDRAEDEAEACFAVTRAGPGTWRKPAAPSVQSCCISPRTMCSREKVSVPMR